MLGFLFGAAFTLFAINLLRRRGLGRGSYSRRRRRREWLLDRLSDRLDTSPSQDAALGDAIDSLFGAFSEERGAFTRARGAVADALKSGHYDASRLERLKGEQDETLGRVHAAVQDALETAHRVLDEEQRAELASLLLKGPPACRGRRLHAA